tara:strand:+ start:226 stop:1251 length:1026 start_codon:yes stop_codon:yes gene_type:complete
MKQYYSKALSKMVTAYEMALAENHEFANQTIKMSTLSGDKKCTTMTVEHSVIFIVERLAPELLNSSWRLIRAGLKLIVDSHLSRGSLSKDKAEELKELMHQKCWMTKKEKKDIGDRLNSTSLRKKSISQEEYDRICRFINNPKKVPPLWGRPTLLWLTSSMLTGLRPNEWADAKIIEVDGKHKLVVKNAKNDEVRGTGEFRRLDISDLGVDDLNIIGQHLDMCAVMLEQDLWGQYYRGCSNLLGYINKVVFPRATKKIGLYTGRHQLTANLKASNMSPTDRSAVLGHSSTDTQVAHYGKRRNGSHAHVPKNDDPEVLNKIRNNQKLQSNKPNAPTQNTQNK